MTMDSNLKTLAGQMATAQQMALSLLRAEMTALSAVMPGLAPPHQGDDARRRAEDEAREAAFDNMPV